MTDEKIDWATFSDYDELLSEGYNCMPAPGCHGVLVEDEFTDGSWAWAWFRSAEERRGWIVRIKQLEPDAEPLSPEEIRQLDAFGAGPVTDAGFTINGGTVSWIGRLEDLLEGSDPVSVRWRTTFWENCDPDEDEYAAPDDPAAPIPPEAVDDFLSSIYPT